MSLQCQKLSYLRQFVSKVVSCQSAKLRGLDSYEVILEDTILFPAGGGQPSDHGKISDIDVLDVERRGGVAVHYLPQPLTIGESVNIWSRRHDHMQQHSGQHLITAIADMMFGYKTTSWNLSPGLDNNCFVELSTPKVTIEELQAIEERCNKCIRQHIPMTPRWLDADSKELEKIRTRGLPDDVVGKVRVVDIEGIDSNMCCGTHVDNLSDIQVIKLLYTEAKKGFTIVHYLAGDRVINYVGKCVQKEKKLNKLLCTAPDEHCDAVERILKSQRQQNKVIRTQINELAQLTVFRHLHTEPVDPLAVIHKNEWDNEFMNIVASEMNSHGILAFLTGGESKGSGYYFLLSGDESIVTEVAPKVSELLEGKGGGRKGRFHGKGTNLSACSMVETLLREKIKLSPTKNVLGTLSHTQ